MQFIPTSDRTYYDVLLKTIKNKPKGLSFIPKTAYLLNFIALKSLYFDKLSMTHFDLSAARQAQCDTLYFQ